jgi:hypothetical protein
MTTPTSGPWAISGIHHSIGIAPDDGKSDGIATVFGCGPKAKANAHLISAAPDLLFALELLLKHEGETELSAVGIELKTDALEKAIRKAKYAIAKAKGGKANQAHE